MNAFPEHRPAAATDTSATDLPMADPEALAASAALTQHLAGEIAAAGGWISFARFMEIALYHPGLGYYSGGARKFGAAGDFVTAPELTPLFAQALAAQAEEILRLSAPRIVEVGAGSGRLAADLLAELERRGTLPESYAILELSGELRARQAATLAASVPHLAPRVIWLDRLPDRFDGLVLANELLDALPVHRVVWGSEAAPHAIAERGVAWAENAFYWRDRPAEGRLRERAEALAAALPLAPGQVGEIGLAAADWTATWASILGRGALLLIDYGFPQHEFYHPQRTDGTLMCHYRHRAHDDPFFLPGLQDITAHVDFTSIVEAGAGAGMDLLGYTAQASFLLNCGLTDRLARTGDPCSVDYLRQAQAVQKLISPAEMGELFKVMALGKGIDAGLCGFLRGERSHRL